MGYYCDVKGICYEHVDWIHVSEQSPRPLTSIKDEKYVDQPTAAGFTRTVPMEILMSTGKSKVQAVKIKLLLCNANHTILLSEYLIYFHSQQWRSSF